MRRALLLLLALPAIFVACNKTPDPQADVISMLRTGKWKLSSGTVNIRGLNGVRADHTYYPDLRRTCLRDNTILFDSSNRGVVYNGSNRCLASEPDSVNFIWQLKNNDQNIDLFNIYKVVDSVGLKLNTVTGSSPTAYYITYDTATSYIANIPNAKLSNVTDNSFTLEYTLVAKYYDSTGGNYSNPILKPDTFVFKATYTH